MRTFMLGKSRIISPEMQGYGIAGHIGKGAFGLVSGGDFPEKMKAG